MNIRIAAVFLFLAFAVLLVHPSDTATANPPATGPAAHPPTLEITAHPAPMPVPALHYRLVPSLPERTSGDAAPIYLMAFLQINMTQDEQKRIDELLVAPPERFSVEEAGKIVQSRKQYLGNIELASRRTQCNWHIPWREQGFGTLLPHLQRCREATRLLALQARLQTRQGRFDEAVHTLQGGFALVEHLKGDAFLIQGLVAVAMSNVLLDRVAELEQAPGCPNLYWALAELPHPLVDMQAMTELERAMPMVMLLPELKGRNLRELSADEFTAVLSRVERMSKAMELQEGMMGERLALAAVVAQQLPAARAWLQSHGYTEKQVNELPPISAVGVYLFEIYQQTADEMFKWMALPYWQAREGLARSERMLRQLQQQGPNPALSLLPAMGKVVDRVAAMDRRKAMLQAVEALRGYAGAHDGKLPPSLGDLTDMPAPVDPMTGRAFEYEVSGNTAILRSAAATERGVGQEGIYRITMLGQKNR